MINERHWNDFFAYFILGLFAVFGAIMWLKLTGAIR